MGPLVGEPEGHREQARCLGERPPKLEGEYDHGDNIETIPAMALGPQIGTLLAAQEDPLTDAIHAAFDFA